MTIIFDSTLNITLSSFKVMPYDAIPLDLAKSTPNWPVVNFGTEVYSLSGIEITRVVDFAYGKQVYFRSMFYLSNNTIAPAGSAGLILLPTLSNILSSDNNYDNPQWTNESVVTAVSSMFVTAATTNTPIPISRYLSTNTIDAFDGVGVINVKNP